MVTLSARLRVVHWSQSLDHVVALFGSTYRNLFSYGILLLMLVVRPNGLFSSKRQLPPEPLTGTFIPNKRRIKLPPWLVIGGAFVCYALVCVVLRFRA